MLSAMSVTLLVFCLVAIALAYGLSRRDLWHFPSDNARAPLKLKLTRFRGARQALNGGFSDAQDASALLT